MTNMCRATTRLKSLLYSVHICASVLCLEAGCSFGLSFCWFSSELEDPAASVQLLRRQEKKKNGGWQDMQIVPPPKERERSFPPAECERVLPLSHTHTHTHRTLNRTLSFDTHWLASTHNPPNHTNVCINWFNTHASAHMYSWGFSHTLYCRNLNTHINGVRLMLVSSSRINWIPSPQAVFHSSASVSTTV